MKSIRIIFGILSILILHVSVAYASIDITINSKDVYDVGEDLIFKYALISDSDISIDYSAALICRDSPQALLELKKADLIGGVPLIEEYSAGVVDDSYHNEFCNFSVMMLEPFNIVKEKSIKIEADKEMDFFVEICKDDACLEKAKVFVLGEEPFISYESSYDGLEISALLIFPDGSYEEIIIPGKLSADKVGSFSIEVSVSKTGFKPLKIVESFAVIEKNVDIVSASRCNADSICDADENYQTCPQDCLSGGEDGYCDMQSDGRCDPDCGESEDVDCRALSAILEGVQVDDNDKNIVSSPGYGHVNIGFIAVIVIIVVISSVWILRFRFSHKP